MGGAGAVDDPGIPGARDIAVNVFDDEYGIDVTNEETKENDDDMFRNVSTRDPLF